jgi:hypothetical protein
MDRLSSYAQREAESESPEQRKKTEEESIAQLMEQMRIAKEKKAAEPEPAPAQQNGDAPETSETEPSTEEASEEPPKPTDTSAETEENQATETDGDIEKRRGIPNNVKLFEIFHEQVQTLVKMQRLPIQDTIGLLVSLANLALYVSQIFTTTTVLILLETSIPKDSITLTKSLPLQTKRSPNTKTAPTYTHKPPKARSSASSFRQSRPTSLSSPRSRYRTSSLFYIHNRTRLGEQLLAKSQGV